MLVQCSSGKLCAQEMCWQRRYIYVIHSTIWMHRMHCAAFNEFHFMHMHTLTTVSSAQRKKTVDENVSCSLLIEFHKVPYATDRWYDSRLDMTSPSIKSAADQLINIFDKSTQPVSYSCYIQHSGPIRFSFALCACDSGKLKWNAWHK